MNLLPSAGHLCIQTAATNVGPVVVLEVSAPYIKQTTASDGLDKHRHLEVWFEESTLLPATGVDALESQCLMSRNFNLDLPFGLITGELVDIHKIPLVCGRHMFHLSFRLFEQRGPAKLSWRAWLKNVFA